MPDPISLAGGLGQLPVAASVPGFPTSPSGSAATGGDQVTVVPGQTGDIQRVVVGSGANSNAAQKSSAQKAESEALSLEDSVKAMRDFLKNLPSDLQFQPDKESGYVIFKVINPVTQEVIRQYPPEEVVSMARKLNAALAAAKKHNSGILLDGQT
jgi:uncharacterized FlaG/YvyC family protein